MKQHQKIEKKYHYTHNYLSFLVENYANIYLFIYF
jgi:hypothetical protein